eukprot:CAMPEP_0119260124 /NCGR_PEP_ID=MMETSP1329-20130426/659_1 /TAXON_ID=114041 /ORGANISM="Genus nov. species nov., Strain RCC1024" /LENGTH=273 /DNA_ID=CAMNT_0007259541 /DNA_START=74 /DNA_END=893 /DNA_ORIENTATION=-
MQKLIVALAAAAVSAFDSGYLAKLSKPAAPAELAAPTLDAPVAVAAPEAPVDSWTDFADEEALYAASTFPIKPDALVARAKEVLAAGVGTKDDGECLADSFEFVAAVVGPLPKDKYLKALGNFKLEEAFDLSPRYHLFRVDPLQTNRVWFHTRTNAVHTGDFMGKAPTGKEVINPPQCMHMDFEEDGKVKEFGFYTVDRRQGNTGGLGGAFAFFNAVGIPLPFPEGKPYKPSKRLRFFNFMGGLAERFAKKEEPTTYDPRKPSREPQAAECAC